MGNPVVTNSGLYMYAMSGGKFEFVIARATKTRNLHFLFRGLPRTASAYVKIRILKVRVKKILMRMRSIVQVLDCVPSPFPRLITVY